MQSGGDILCKKKVVIDNRGSSYINFMVSLN